MCTLGLGIRSKVGYAMSVVVEVIGFGVSRGFVVGLAQAYKVYDAGLGSE